jgi:hypothetical protein
MKELHAEGLATHSDPESWDYCREAEGQALTGAHASWPLSREINQSEVPTSLAQTEGNTRRDAMRVPERPQRGLRPQASVEPSCKGTGRSTDRSWVAPRAAKGRRTQCVGSRR